MEMYIQQQNDTGGYLVVDVWAYIYIFIKILRAHLKYVHIIECQLYLNKFHTKYIFCL